MWFLGGTIKFLKHKSDNENIKISITKYLNNIEENNNIDYIKFPKYRANVEEGYGTIEDGVFEYFCNNCMNTITKNRYRITNKEDYDLCDECFYEYIYSDNFDNKFTYTIRNELDAENREINNLVNIIFRDYNNSSEGIKIDFSHFLISKLMKKYQHYIWSCNHLSCWMKKFNSYTLHKFTQSHFYKNNIRIKTTDEYFWPNTSVY